MFEFSPCPKPSPEDRFEPLIDFAEKPIAKSPETGDTQATGTSTSPEPQYTVCGYDCCAPAALVTTSVRAAITVPCCVKDIARASLPDYRDGGVEPPGGGVVGFSSPCC